MRVACTSKGPGPGMPCFTCWCLSLYEDLQASRENTSNGNKTRFFVSLLSSGGGIHTLPWGHDISTLQWGLPQFSCQFQHCHSTQALLTKQVFPVGASGKETACNAGDVRDAGSIPGLGRSSGGGHRTLLQYSCPENPMNRGAWWAMVQRVAKSWT